MAGQMWEVVGGASTGGILVRAGRPLDSPEVGERLQTGSVVRQIELRGERLHFELVEGAGPARGWVSLKLKGKDLVVKTHARAERRKLLLLSIPWKGHIVHLRRIAEWFEGRAGYEAHFGVFPQSADVVPSGSVAHVAQGDETQAAAMFDALEDSFRDLARSTKDHREGLGSMLAAMIEVIADFAEKKQDPFACFFRFCIRLIQEVKPHVVVGDATCESFGLLPALCSLEGIKYMWVQSPGLREIKAESAASEMGLTKPDGKPDDSVQNVVKGLGVTLHVLAKAMGVPVEVLENQGKGSKPMAGGFQMTFLGMLQTCTMTPDFAPFLCKPLGGLLGLDTKKMLQMLTRVGELANQADPVVWLLPSARALVCQDPRPGDLYTGSFLPLPGRDEEGRLQRQGRADFEAAATQAVDHELLEWLFAEEETDPIVYIAFGTIVQPSEAFLHTLVQALQGGAWRVLWALPASLQKLLPTDLAPNRWRVMNFVPQAAVLTCDRVHAFVSHMGANSTTESLACGVPMVCCPFYMDQYEWSQVVCGHWKAGVEVDRSGPPEGFRVAVQRVLNEPGFKEGAARASEAMYSASGAMLTRLERLGNGMKPKDTLGVGVSVAAAAIMRCMDGAPLDPIFELTS